MTVHGGMTYLVSRMRFGLEKFILPPKVHWYFFLAYLAVLPIAGPIALRNVVLAILVFQSLFFCFATYKSGNPSAGIGKPTAWLMIWASFLVLFPLIARDPGVAWRELGGQWAESLLAWFVAFVVVRRISPTGRDLLWIGLASAFYPFVYLILFLWAWMGGVGYPAYIEDTSWAEILEVLARNAGSVDWPGLSSFPWGFRGFDPIHANLGATAAHAFIAFAAWGLADWYKGREIKKLAWLIFLLSCSYLVPVLASSRASILCISFMVLLAIFVAVAQLWRGKSADGGKSAAGRLASLGIPVLGVLCLMGFLAYQSYEKDPRWRTMMHKATIGFWVPDAMGVVCHGISAELESGIRNRLAGMPAHQVDEILQGMRGDGGRVLVMRAGLQLVLEQPFGLDGSRSAYKRSMHERCGGVPSLDFAHPHQGWIDLALALGWGGMLLYLGMVIYLLWTAVAGLLKKEWSGWELGLFMLCIFWISRGFFDSVYREHFLQMQGALIGFFWAGWLQDVGDRQS